MLTSDLKNFVKENCDNLLVSIGHVEDLTPEELAAQRQLNLTLAKYTPLYNPETPVCNPRDFLDTAQAMIVLGFNFFFGRRDLPGKPPRSEIMNFYVNPDSITYIMGETQKVIDFLGRNGYTGISLSSGISVKLMASRSGIGAYGKNGVIIAPPLGSWVGLSLIITDAPLAIDTPPEDYCKSCTICQKSCPTGALDTAYRCNVERCLTLHMVNNKGMIPRDIREKAGFCIAQCNICLDVCPKNRNMQVQTAIAAPEELVFPEVAPFVNITPEDYQKKFGDTFFEFMFMDKKYLQRNAAIALGNYGDPAYIPVLVQAMESDPEEIVRAHAVWALGKIGTSQAKAALEKCRKSEASSCVQEEMLSALERI